MFLVTRSSAKSGAFLIRNYSNSNSLHEGEIGWECWKAARASSAAPFYFIPFVSNEVKYRDGGVGYNNPSNLALDELWSLTLKQPRDSVHVVVSLGCGKPPNRTSQQKTASEHKHLVRKLWESIKGLLFPTQTLQNAGFLVNHLTDVEAAQKYIENRSKIESFPYYRLNPDMEEEMALDVHSSFEIQKIIDLTKLYISKEQALISEICNMLLA